MTVIGFVFYAVVLHWSLEHTERESQYISEMKDTTIGDAPDKVMTPIISDPPVAELSPTRPPTQAPIPSPTQQPKKSQPPTREPKAAPTRRPTLEPKQEPEKKFQPRLLIISADDNKQHLYNRVSIPHHLNKVSRSRSIDFILPVTNITSSPSPSLNHNKTEDIINDAASSTLSPVQQRREQCIPQEKWQTDSFVNCNQLHELDMVGGSIRDKLVFLGQGWFRAAWKLSFLEYNADGGANTSDMKESQLVLKTLRLEREFLDEYYELHRRDAVAMERLTWSPYVMDVYGYCGQSAMNELANFRKEVNNLEQLDRAMRNVKHKDSKSEERLNYMKLKLAASVAIGLSHVHRVHPSSNSNSSAEITPALMAHYDINPRNIAVVSGGQPKLNDFNIAEFIRYNPTTNATCAFPSRLHEPWWRAPEEMYIPNNTQIDMRLVTEKVDVYALGAVLFHILTTHSPRGKMKKERMVGVREEVAQGIAPPLPAPYNTSTSTAVVAIRHAMDLCFVVNPAKRGTSRQVASLLRKAVKDYGKDA